MSTNELIELHRRKTTRAYIRRITNLIKIERFQEAADTTIYLASILRMWAQQEIKAKESALRGVGRKENNEIKA